MTSILDYLFGQSPILTPGYNGQANPGDAILRNQSITTPGTPLGGPQPSTSPAQQGGLRGLLGNPQLLQGLTALLMTKLGGAKGGYMGKGYLDAMKSQQDLDLEKRKLASDEAYRNRQLGIQEAGEKRQGEILLEGQKQTKERTRQQWMDDARQYADSMGVNMEDALELTKPEGMEVTPAMLKRAATMQAQIDAVRKTKEAEAKAKYFYYDPKTKEVFDSPGPGRFRVETGSATGNAILRPTQGDLSMDEQAYADWVKKPGNAGKGKDDYLKWKAGLSPTITAGLREEKGAPALIPGSEEQMIGQLDPNTSAKVKAILEYRTNPTGYMLSRSEDWRKAYDYALQIDPTYDAKEFPTRSKMMANYTSATGSSAGAQINAINTVLGHTAVLGEAVDALENGNIQLLNRIANAYGVQVGETPVTTLKAIVNRVGPEVTRAYVGTGGEASERAENAADFNENYSPKQLKDNVAITIRLLRSKIGSLENQWKQTMKRDDFEGRFITPEAKAAIEKWGAGGEAAGGQIREQRNQKTGEYRYSTDGGKTWQPGRAPRR